jgi:hypothetical protein
MLALAILATTIHSRRFRSYKPSRLDADGSGYGCISFAIDALNDVDEGQPFLDRITRKSPSLTSGILFTEVAWLLSDPFTNMNISSRAL